MPTRSNDAPTTELVREALDDVAFRDASEGERRLIIIDAIERALLRLCAIDHLDRGAVEIVTARARKENTEIVLDSLRQ